MVRIEVDATLLHLLQHGARRAVGVI